MVRVDVSSIFSTCIKDVREKSLTLGSAGNRVLKGESLEQFSVYWQLRKFLCWSQTPSHIGFLLLFNGHKGCIFCRPMMFSVNLFMSPEDFPFHKFAFYGVSVPHIERDDILPSNLTVVVFLICKVHFVMEIWKLLHLRF